jgi:heme-degrading monooxygenase HmoA
LDGGEYLLLNKWMTEADARTWLDGAQHKELDRQAAASVKGFERIDGHGATLLHQQFGADGGRVIDHAERRPEMTPAAV